MDRIKQHLSRGDESRSKERESVDESRALRVRLEFRTYFRDWKFTFANLAEANGGDIYNGIKWAVFKVDFSFSSKLGHDRRKDIRSSLALANSL